MSFALSAGVTGLQAHQKMIDIAGNNLANVNTTAFKSSRITFSELLSETVKKASQPTTTVGGTNPQQMGSGVGVAGITPNMTQGNIVNTGNPLDLAIEGKGYFVLNDGQQDLYTRAGAFGVDADSNLVDPATGFRVQRYGILGVSDGFQDAGVSDLHVPYDVPIDPRATTQIKVAGNLSADGMLATAQTQLMASNITYSKNSTAAVGTTLIKDLDQYTGTLSSGTITFSGYKPGGTALGATPETDLTMPVTATTTLNDILTWLNTDDGMANEQQTITCTETSGGSFTVDFQDTGSPVAIAYNATAAEVQEALEDNLSSISAGDVTVTGGPLGGSTAGSTVVVEFTGSLGGTDVADFVIVDTGLTSGNASAAETKQGTKAIDEKQTISFTNATGGTYTLDFENTGSPQTISYGADAATVKAALANLSTLAATDLNVTGGGTAGADVVIEFIGSKDGTDVSMLTIDDTNLTGTSPSASVAETVKGRGLQGILGSDATASLVNGQIRITDSASGYSQSDLAMAWSGDGTLTMPGYFEMLTPGGNEVKNVNIMTYDSLGGKHVFSGAFVRTNTANTWDIVLASMSGNVNQITMPNRRIEGIIFDQSSGYYNGLGADPAEFVVSYANDPLNPQTIALDFGTIGKLNGLTQFAGNSTAVAKEQDGYEPGNLSNVSVSNDGVVIGAFSNGIKKDIGAIKISLFQNTSGLETVGGGYLTSSANSGEPAETQAMTGGAGSVHGGALEKSNSDVATQFVSMIQAQNGFQANARTIRVANDILRELSNLIR